MATIGIPRTLTYFFDFPFWHAFFTALGQRVVVSQPTSRATLDRGVACAESEICLPVKLVHGHVAELSGACDLVFVPRVVAVRRFGEYGRESMCPKLLGLPDMLLANLPAAPPLLHPHVDLRQGWRGRWRVARELGRQLGAGDCRCLQALWCARRAQREYRRLLRRGLPAPEAIEAVVNGKAPAPRPPAGPIVAVLGYPYLLYDSYVNAGVLRMLQRAGIDVRTQDSLWWRDIAGQGRRLPKELFWYFSNRILHAGMYFAAQPQVAGIVHLSAFACGPDSMLRKMLEIAARRANTPFLALTLDEHAADVGLRTRVEAFVDMLEWRRRER
ncbi:MAG: acyl-CoA dehydratase activase-related protein [Syntrophomonadaceae bacterium]|nr:acyl-CoA dehydratase activase-related protein [Syntrophomonadaceae bacterium]